MEAEILLEAFFDRVKSIDLATDELDPFWGSNVYGLESLPISISI
jgi:hypothetical protein